MEGETTHVMEGETTQGEMTRGEQESGRNDPLPNEGNFTLVNSMVSEKTAF